MAKETLTKKTEKELEELITLKRTEIQSERFKDKMSRKASVFQNARKTIARALTELQARRIKASSEK